MGHLEMPSKKLDFFKKKPEIYGLYFIVFTIGVFRYFNFVRARPPPAQAHDRSLGVKWLESLQ